MVFGFDQDGQAIKFSRDETIKDWIDLGPIPNPPKNEKRK